MSIRAVLGHLVLAKITETGQMNLELRFY